MMRERRANIKEHCKITVGSVQGENHNAMGIQYTLVVRRGW